MAIDIVGRHRPTDLTVLCCGVCGDRVAVDQHAPDYARRVARFLAAHEGCRDVDGQPPSRER